MICTFCGLENYLGDGLHPCCVFAKELGEDVCLGCDTFKKRWARGETCPHVQVKTRACCRP